MRLKVSSAKWWPCYIGLNVLIIFQEISTRFGYVLFLSSYVSIPIEYWWPIYWYFFSVAYWALSQQHWACFCLFVSFSQTRRRKYYCVHIHDMHSIDVMCTHQMVLTLNYVKVSHHGWALNGSKKHTLSYFRESATMSFEISWHLRIHKLLSLRCSMWSWTIRQQSTRAGPQCILC